MTWKLTRNPSNILFELLVSGSDGDNDMWLCAFVWKELVVLHYYGGHFCEKGWKKFINETVLRTSVKRESKIVLIITITVFLTQLMLDAWGEMNKHVHPRVYNIDAKAVSWPDILFP